MNAVPLRPDPGAALADELAHLDALGTGEELWENHGWVVRASDGERELLLWLAFYIIRGRQGGRFTVDDVRIAQSIVIDVDVPHGERDRMHDLPFSVFGVHWSEYHPPAELRCERDGDAAVWSLADRRHVSSPPTWRVVGTCGELEVDLVFEALAPVFRFEGFELISGYEALARVTGTVVRDGAARTIRGFGQHEKVHTVVPIQRDDGAGWSTSNEADRHLWHCGAGERLAVSLLANQPGERRDLVNGHVLVDGAVHRFSREQVSFRETGSWSDPRSGVVVPTSFEVAVELDAGSLALEVTSWARAYYLWDYIRGSTSLLYWFLGRAAAVWHQNGVETVTEVIPYVAHTNRPFLYWGTRDG